EERVVTEAAERGPAESAPPGTHMTAAEVGAGKAAAAKVTTTEVTAAKMPAATAHAGRRDVWAHRHAEQGRGCQRDEFAHHVLLLDCVGSERQFAGTRRRLLRRRISFSENRCPLFRDMRERLPGSKPRRDNAGNLQMGQILTAKLDSRSPVS